MKIVIDYNKQVPTKEMEEKMNRIKDIVIKQLEPIKEEFDKSEGILLLNINGYYDLNLTPTYMVIKIRNLIELNPFSPL